MVDQRRVLSLKSLIRLDQVGGRDEERVAVRNLGSLIEKLDKTVAVGRRIGETFLRLHLKIGCVHVTLALIVSVFGHVDGDCEFEDLARDTERLAVGIGGCHEVQAVSEVFHDVISLSLEDANVSRNQELRVRLETDRSLARVAIMFAEVIV